MRPVELLLLQLPGVADFSIDGALPSERVSASPALTRTSVVHAATGTIVHLSVLSESMNAERFATTAPFLFEQTTYQFNVALHVIDQRELRLLLRGTDLLAGRRQIGTQRAYSVSVNFQSEVGYTDV